MGKLKSTLILVIVPLVLVSSSWVAFDYLELKLSPIKLLIFGNNSKLAAETVPPVAKVNAKEFDYYMFTQQWGPSVWNRAGKIPDEFKDFMIHGLWPESHTRNLNNGCKGKDKYKEIKDPKLIERLKKSWPNLDKNYPTDEKFWESEYNNHGTCAADYNQQQYFDEALKLKENRFNDLLNFLKGKGKGPGSRFKTKDLVSLVEEYTLSKGKASAPDLMCKKDGRRTILCEIRICLTPELQPDNCPNDKSKDTSCYKDGDDTNLEYP